MSEGSDDLTASREAEEASDSSEGSDGEQGTTSTSRRWWLTNDLLAIGMAVSLIGIVAAHGAGWLNLQTLPEWLTGIYVFSVGTSVAWAFGEKAIEAWRSKE